MVGLIRSVLLFHFFVSGLMWWNEMVLWTWRVDVLNKLFDSLPGAGVVCDGFVDSFYFGFVQVFSTHCPRRTLLRYKILIQTSHLTESGNITSILSLTTLLIYITMTSTRMALTLQIGKQITLHWILPPFLSQMNSSLIFNQITVSSCRYNTYIVN